MTETIVRLDPARLFGLEARGFHKGRPNSWTRNITGVDRSKRGGFSFLGDFMRTGEDNYEVGRLYLDCEVRSRAQAPGQWEVTGKTYRLFQVEEGPRLKLLQIAHGGRWAPAMWPIVEGVLAGAPVTPVAESSVATARLPDDVKDSVRGLRADALEIAIAEEVSLLRDEFRSTKVEGPVRDFFDSLGARLSDLKRWADQGNEAAQAALGKIGAVAAELRELLPAQQPAGARDGGGLPAVQDLLAQREPQVGHELEGALYLLRQAARRSSEEVVKKLIQRALGLLGAGARDDE